MSGRQLPHYYEGANDENVHLGGAIVGETQCCSRKVFECARLLFSHHAEIVSHSIGLRTPCVFPIQS
jgi:hypothetical protein